MKNPYTLHSLVATVVHAYKDNIRLFTEALHEITRPEDNHKVWVSYKADPECLTITLSRPGGFNVGDGLAAMEALTDEIGLPFGRFLVDGPMLTIYHDAVTDFEFAT